MTIGDHRLAVAGPAKDDGSFTLAASHGRGRQMNEARVVDRIRREGPEVDGFMTGRYKVGSDSRLVCVASVV